MATVMGRGRRGGTIESVSAPTSTEGVVTAETKAAIGELKREHEVTDADLVVHVSRYRVDESPSLTIMPAAQRE